VETLDCSININTFYLVLVGVTDIVLDVVTVTDPERLCVELTVPDGDRVTVGLTE
jgi:CTP-dependent riboflavin kinase